MSDQDESLLARVRDRDPDALAQFIDRRRRQLLAYIERHMSGALRAKVEPDDILQDASAEAVRSLPDFDLSERDPFGWLCQIAERRIIDTHRRFFATQKRDAAREVRLHSSSKIDTSRAGIIDLLVVSMTSASQAMSRDMKQARMLEALEELPEQQREALRLRYIDGLPSKQIADRLGKSDGAIRVMLTRAIARLQAQLIPGGND